ncbi:LOB domain-containing protein 1-like isoform X1 [Cucurbita maxima]|uniref:LOB domain-containing protein 1-like isoform X1 n=1 Tax=Cucurbita maxima TaxID=3661 RepID=A0A6J1I3T6_CUCMA|nr:LOB domain-containing protein 1-like isoform X1 [Cucurbita maxima]
MDAKSSPTSTIFRSQSPSSSPLPPPPSVQAGLVVSPCAACKTLRRRCTEKCVLAPYFPPSDPLKFTIAHRIFGASNIIKLLQDLPESQRIDAVSSLVYEASARIRDPVYGCAGAISQLQKQINELQAELAKTQAELVNIHSHQTNLVALICKELAQTPPPVSPPDHHALDNNLNTAIPQSYTNLFEDSSIWEPLWT